MAAGSERAALALVLGNATDLGLDLDHGHDHGHGREEVWQTPAPARDLVVAKVVAMLVLGAASFALGALPVKLASWLRWPAADKPGAAAGHSLVVSLLLCFGGGVLLFTTFLHLQPEVREGFGALQAAGRIPRPGHGIHLAELVFCAGFFFVYLVEELVHAVLDRRPLERADEAVLHRAMSLRRCSRHPPPPAEGEPPPPPPPPPQEDGCSAGSAHSTHSTHGLLSAASGLSAIAVLDGKPGPLDAELRMSGGPLGPAAAAAGPPPPRRPARPRAASGHGHSHAVPFRDDDDEDSSGGGGSTVAKSLRGLLAVLALSFHAVFEGLAVGLETSVGNVWYLFAAIATHKLVIAFCVGVELVGSRTRLPLLLVYVATFAAVTPLGIGVGLALSGAGPGEAAAAATPATVALQGMAAGTLLYVVFFEVLQRERANAQAGIWQLAAIVAGFAVMFALQVATGHEHSHGGDGDGDGDHDHDHEH